MTIYLDSDFRCYLDNADGRLAVETGLFDGKPKEYIEGYQYIPDGYSWTRADGAVFYGLMIAPATDYNRIMTEVAISYLDDDQAESVTVLFPSWQTDTDYAVGDRRQDYGLLYRCVQAHHSQDDWRPADVPALWVRTSTEEWPEWVQPTGAQDAYRIGDKCSYKGKHWINNVDYNVYAPDVYGWSEVE